MKRIAIIGSFQRTDNYELVRELIAFFEKEGLTVVSPAGTIVADNREGFVVFESDNRTQKNEKIQYDTLVKIFSAHVVYVVNIDGYVGKTTCYEIGRILERRQPIYFYSHPQDLPICITEEFIVSPVKFMEIICNSGESILNLECSSCKKYQICSGGDNVEA